MNKPLTLKDALAERQIKFELYGVKIGVRADRQSHLERIFRLLRKTYPGGLETVPEDEIEYRFEIKKIAADLFELHRNGKSIIQPSGGQVFFDSVESQIRICVAEFARAKVFLHAGVVGWKGRAIILPGRSHAGKTTLVAELVRKGAAYYSDEYAVLNEDASVQPFPKWLSLRGIIDDFTQLDCPVESLGGTAGTQPIPVGLVLLATYRRGKKIPKKWQPKRLSGGQGIMEILPHTFPIRNKPKFVLEVLNKLATRAIIVKTVRGEAEQFADALLNFFEYQTD